MFQFEKLLKGDVANNNCPVHPALVNLPLALYPLSALIRWVATQPRLSDHLRGLDVTSLNSVAHYLNIAALIVTVPTALTGLIEYRTIEKGNAEALSTVHKHILLNTVVTLIGVYNWWTLRTISDFAPTMTNVFLGLVGTILLWYSGHLGGKLVYKHGIGVRRQGDKDD
jgi:uncharacterized membrane protein